MSHPANSHVLIDPVVKMFQVPVTQTAWGQGQPRLEHFVPLRRATPPIPLTTGNYSPIATGQKLDRSAARYLSFRFAETLGEIPWGMYISYKALDQGAADLCSLGLTPSDALRIAYDIAREVGYIRYALDFNLLNLGYHFASNTQTFNPQKFSAVSSEFAVMTNDANFMFGHDIEHIARARVLKKLQRVPIHQAGANCLSMVTATPPLSMDQLFETVEVSMTTFGGFANSSAMMQIHDTLRTLRGKSRLRKSPAGGRIPLHMMK